jgi:hypothetical protein
MRSAEREKCRNGVSKDVSFHTVAHAVSEAKFVPRVEDFEGMCSAFCVHCIQKDYENRFIFFSRHSEWL